MDLCAIIVGISYFILSAIFLFINGIIIVVLSVNKEFKSITYRIIKTLCFSCILQLIPFLIGGVMSVAQSSLSYHLDRVLGILVQSGWMFYICVTFTLAVDRLLIFTCPRSPKLLTIPVILLIFSFIFCLSTATLMALNVFSFTYKHAGGYYFWGYDIEGNRKSAFVLSIEPYVDMGIFAMNFVVYIAICIHLLKMKKLAGPKSNFQKAEIRIFTVALISFTYEALFVIWTFWVPIFSILGVKATFIFLNMTWIVECGMFASLTLIINGNLRRKVMDMVVEIETSLGITERTPSRAYLEMDLCAIIIGTLYFLLSFTFLVLNGTIIFVLSTNKEFRTSTYRIIKTLCFSCMLQLVSFWIGGIMTISQSTLNYYLDRVLGVLVESSWFFYVSISLTLAVDRLLVFICIRSSDFSIITTILLGLSWLFFLCIVVAMGLQLFGYTYEHHGMVYQWGYTSTSGSRIVMKMEPYFDMGVFAMIFTIYSVLCVYLFKVLGIIIESSWLFYVCISLTLAVDRFLIFVHPSCTTLATILLGSSWLFWISTMVVMSLPGFGYTYKHPLGYYLWMWNAGSGSAVVAEIEPFFDVSVFIVIFVMYAIVVRKIMQLKRTATSSSYRTELRICVVAAGSFIYETLFIAVTFWMPFDVLGEKEMYVVLNVIWMIDCGMFASLTLVFNTVLRRKVILLVKGNDVIHVSSNRVT
ncbi:hypothetical protein QR680_003696 [Steinernema hermaphroditum]|uniref:Uncharacterized protein n=1 Tax=Steinernema hermaphroditum TaxID=289476 RepID=A0AA39HL87_9BILA|nr:hypothetical protein QR680_003696 [Steinernema hermaphroditum]